MINFLLIILFSFLSSCTSVELAANLGKKVFVKKDRTEKSNGIYKIGNPYVVAGKRYYPKKDLNYDKKENKIIKIKLIILLLAIQNMIRETPYCNSKII